MLKPLLRTLPALSGNIKIACTLSDYDKVGPNDWTAFVRTAKMLPISSNLSQRNIDINLLYSSYDYDAPRFFKYYSAVFYDDVFEYDKSNYIQLDRTEAQKNRNTDFEYGCKRVSWMKNEKQFAFYAPIYVESIDDMPDFFMLNITLRNERFTIDRNIKIQISKEDVRNYLKVYLTRYLNKIDSHVIFCNINGKNGVYYGIDLTNGGCTKVLDNMIAKAFTRQNTINNFDAIITNGFQRNLLAMKQILPLCWYFSINDILTEDEKKKFINSKMYVSGQWYKDGEAVPFYNIDTNYKEYYESPFVINKGNGLFVYKSNPNNIMNMEYPSLNESMYTGYRYTNKLNLKYNRWKLKYSDDEHPYITNLSPAFSMNQSSIYKYGGFPEKYRSLNLITDTKNNIIIPIGAALKSKDSPYINDYTLVANYISTLNNNVSTWYHLTNDITDIYKQDIWRDIQDDRVYYKGILYDFNKIYEHYPNLTEKIDKFSVIVNLHFNKLSKDELKNINKADTSIFISDKYKTDKTAWISPRVSEGFSSGEFNLLPAFYNTASTFNNGNAQIVFDKLYEKSDNGDFIDLLSLGYNVYNINKYFKYSDILSVFTYKNGYYDIAEEKLIKNENFDLYFVEGYEHLPVYKLYNVLHENNRDITFEAKESGKWILDNLYFSQHGNYYKSPYDRDTIVKLFKDYGGDKYMIPLYLKGKFISKANFAAMLYDIYGNDYTQYNDLIEQLTVYEFHPRIKDDTSATYACDVFVKKDSIMNDNYGNFITNEERNKDNDVLYIDPYNIDNVISNYRSRFGNRVSNIGQIDKFNMYAKFLNMKHLLYYVTDLYKDGANNENLSTLIRSIFIKKRVIIGDKITNNLTFKDYYIPFYNLYDRHRLLTKAEKISILNNSGNASTNQNSWNGLDWTAFKRLIKEEKGIDNPVPDFTIDDSAGKLHVYASELHNNGIDILESTSISSIFIKNKNTGNYYSNDSYKLICAADGQIFSYAVFWYCNNASVRHRCVMNADGSVSFDGSGCGDTHKGGTFEFYKLNWTANLTIDEYHYEDFYYKPTLYIKDQSGEIINYYTFVEYLNKYANISNRSVLEYLNDDLIDILISKDVDELTIEDLPFGNGRHESMRPLGFDNIDLSDPQFYDVLVELKAEILRIISLVKPVIYYIPYGTTEYVKYNNFTGVNEYALLTKDMKISILEGELNILTYVIDDTGKFVPKAYDNDEYYTLYSLDDTKYINSVINQFLSDVKFYENNNYFMMDDSYHRQHDFDNLIGVTDYDTPFRSQNGFEICYKKYFYKIDKNIYNLMNLENEDYPYKDLYIYKAYKEDEYPSSLRMYYTDNDKTPALVEEITNCLSPLFDDIILQDKKYTVIYSEYAQANIYKAKIGNNERYRYNASDTMFMYDISSLPYNKEYVTVQNGVTKLCYTYSYWHELKKLGNSSYMNHSILPTYSLINNCYSTISEMSDDLSLYDRFNINTYTVTEYEPYSYTYTYTVLETIKDDKITYTVLSEKEGVAIGTAEHKTTYGFIYMNAYIDNTNSSFNIIDTKYKKKKYFTYVNEHDIYDENYNILDSFNLLIPFSNINLVENLFKFDELIVHPTKCVFNTYYKQTPLIDDAGYTYAYNINMKPNRIDTVTLQRYFNNIVPYIPQTNIINSTYCLKYKDYKYVNTDVNYLNDVFYSEDINIYNYNRLKVYDSNGSYQMFEPIEYKHLNSSKLINLSEEFEIVEKGTHTYEELIELEKDEYVFEKFKSYIRENELNAYNEDEILFLFNRYKIEYDTECIGLNAVKTQKLYTLTYKFTLL